MWVWILLCTIALQRPMTRRGWSTQGVPSRMQICVSWNDISTLGRNPLQFPLVTVSTLSNSPCYSSVSLALAQFTLSPPLVLSRVPSVIPPFPCARVRPLFVAYHPKINTHIRFLLAYTYRSFFFPSLFFLSLATPRHVFSIMSFWGHVNSWTNSLSCYNIT